MKDIRDIEFLSKLRTAIFLLSTSALLAACIPKPSVSLSGPGRVAGRANYCANPDGNITLNLPSGMEVLLRGKINETIGGEGYTLNVYFDFVGEKKRWDTPGPRILLLSSKAGIGATSKEVPLKHFRGRGGWYGTDALGAEEHAARTGKFLRDIDLGPKGSLEFDIPEFFGASTEITLPPLLIEGKRVDVPAVILHKGASYIGLCAHG